MRRFRRLLILLAALLILLNLIFIDYQDLSWSVNAGAYLGIIAMGCVVIAMIFSNRHEKREEANPDKQ